MGQDYRPLCGSTWTERDRTLVEYYWLKGEDTLFIAKTVDRTPKAVGEMIRRFIRPNKPYKRKRTLSPRPHNYHRLREVAA